MSFSRSSNLIIHRVLRNRTSLWSLMDSRLSFWMEAAENDLQNLVVLSWTDGQVQREMAFPAFSHDQGHGQLPRRALASHRQPCSASVGHSVLGVLVTVWFLLE